VRNTDNLVNFMCRLSKIPGSLNLLKSLRPISSQYKNNFAFIILSLIFNSMHTKIYKHYSKGNHYKHHTTHSTMSQIIIYTQTFDDPLHNLQFWAKHLHRTCLTWYVIKYWPPTHQFSDGRLSRQFSYSSKEDIIPCTLLSIHAYLKNHWNKVLEPNRT
jgi:hypothetical protein